jgi:ribosome-binding factor A
MPNPRRVERLAALIEEIVSELLQREIKDPRVAGLISVTRVQLSQDARHAKIYVSVLGSEEERQATMQVLERAKGFIRSKLGSELTIRHVPEVQFVLDRSLEQGDRVLAILRGLEIPPPEPEGGQGRT